MAKSLTLLLSLALTTLVSAHVQIYYPPWRGNSFLSPYSQTIYPCAGIYDADNTTRTPWPLDGGSINVTLRDSAAIVFVNLGLGVNTTNFNISLLPDPISEVGKGTFCLPKLDINATELGITEGTKATIQFATSDPGSGEGLYNCADIVFTANATTLSSGQCQNSSTVTGTPLFSTTTTSNSTNTSSSGSTSSTTSGSDRIAVSAVALVLSGLLALSIY